jgi:predicted glycoside hydrolase/deacetylase ChbG (UPF0249 family)
MATWCRAHPDADVGVHITLNCEWDRYRWGALSTRDPASGLIDDEGYMWRSVQELFDHMDPDAAISEMRAQIDYALALGIDVTHIDTHMGSVMHARLLPAYVQLALEYRLPAMLPRIPKERMAEWGVDPALGELFLSHMDDLAAGGFPILHMILAAREEGDHLDVYRRLFDAAPAGITHLLLHPSAPGHDIEAIAGSAAYRIADYETFLRPELREYVVERGIHLIGYRRLRDLIRGEL